MAVQRLSPQGNTTRSEGRRFERAPSFVNLGLEPPLEADGQRHSDDDHRRVSLRWLGGTVLTGLAGAVLISAAILAAFDRKSRVAEAPEQASHKDSVAGELVNTRKGDRLLRPVDIIAAKQTFKAPSSTIVGDREVVRVRGFTRVATNLTLSSFGFAEDVPTFNPLKLLANSRDSLEVAPDSGPVQDDSEISFSLRDLAGIDLSASESDLTPEEVQAQVNEYIKVLEAAGNKPSLPLPSQLMLMRTSRASLDINSGFGFATGGDNVISAPFSSIEVRMVPENVTKVTKNPTQESDERLIVMRRGETLDDVLRNLGASRDQIRALSSIISQGGQPALTEGQRLKVLLADIDGTATKQVARISIYKDEQVETTVAVNDENNYVLVAKASTEASSAKRGASDDEDDEEETGGMRLYDSLFETALKQDIPRPIIDDLVRVFANDIDFQRPVAAGDTFEAFYTENEEAGEHNDLLFAAITIRNETYKYYRYQTAEDNLIDYYDENGRSSRKFLIRKPISTGEQRSGFGMRRHPILGYTRMHTGVDWAAPIGTPIFAAGNGTVIKAGRESGYGNRVEIQHANGYITTYNHMTGFARGIQEGVRVRQGQTVGFLGMTGLATGPHLHYEVIVNGHFVDPLRVKLARTRELDARTVASFRRERDRIDGLISKAPGYTRVATRQPAAN